MVTKDIVREYWNENPCGTAGVACLEGTLEYFDAVAEKRNGHVPYLRKYAEFQRWEGKFVLEVGCGVGTDLVKFAEAGAIATGIDLSPKSVGLARQNLEVHKLKGVAVNGDAENIPYKNNVFDFVYSWGVIHHTPNMQKAINEIHRVLKPEGEACIMLYRRPSLVCLQMWLLHGLFALRPFRSLDDIFYNHHESRGTKVCTIKEAYRMFSKFSKVRIEPVVTIYDLRYMRDGYLPLWMRHLIPNWLGWNMIIRGVK